jgi:hypothetical protein
LRLSIKSLIYGVVEDPSLQFVSFHSGLLVDQSCESLTSQIDLSRFLGENYSYYLASIFLVVKKISSFQSSTQ